MNRQYFLLPILALSLAACSTDDDASDLSSPAVEALGQITVNAGGLGTRATETRGANYHMVMTDADCKADRIIVRTWSKLEVAKKTPSFSPDELTTVTQGCDEILAKKHSDAHLKWNKFQPQITLQRTKKSFNDGYTAFVATGLAFRDQDRGRFSLSAASTRFDQQTVTLHTAASMAAATTRCETPELFFAPLAVDIPDKGGYDLTPHAQGSSHGIHVWECGSSNNNILLRNANYYGVLFRIVSQLNLNVRNVPAEVAALELLAERVPWQITLYGNHGGTVLYDDDLGYTIFNEADASYPVTAATAAQCFPASDGFMSIATIDLNSNVTSDATARLSAFLLPSEIGIRTKMRVWYKSVAEGQPEYKDYNIQPVHSATLTGRNAQYQATDGRVVPNTSTRELYVYDAMHGTFYSWANVRVNVNADFATLASEQTTVDATIEVEPSFVQTHTFNAN